MIVCAHAVMPGTLGYGLSIIGSAVEETCTRRKHEILGILGMLGCQSASILCIVTSSYLAHGIFPVSPTSVHAVSLG